MNLDRTYLLAESAGHLEVFTLDDGRVAIHAPALVSSAEAQQIANGILAVLSGQFDRAISESTLAWDLARRSRATSRSESASTPATQPELDSL